MTDLQILETLPIAKTLYRHDFTRQGSKSSPLGYNTHIPLLYLRNLAITKLQSILECLALIRASLSSSALLSLYVSM